jgi:hypothetical protein
MEWYHFVTPITAGIGLVSVWAVNNYRIGQTEKKVEQNKMDQEDRCAACRSERKDQKHSDETRASAGSAMVHELLKAHTAQVLANATEHSAMNINAARTEEQLKNLLAKIEDLANAVHRIERDMPRDYRPSPETGQHRRGG